MKKPKQSKNLLAGAVFLTTTLAAGAAGAGIMDSPINNFPNGDKAVHRFSVPGVVANKGGLSTVIMCTSMEKTERIHIGVEVFDRPPGPPLNDISAGNGVVFADPGGTRTFEIDNVDATVGDVLVGVGGNQVDQGSARIVSTSAKIICSALLMSEAGTPPTSMTSLQVIKKSNQKGD